MKELVEKIISVIDWKTDIAKPFSMQHAVILLAALLAAASMAWFLSGKQIKAERVAAVAGGFLLFAELFKQIFLTCVRGWEYSWSDFPFQLCSIPLYLCLIYKLCKPQQKRAVESFFMTYALTGGLAALIYPVSIFSYHIMLTLHSVIWHGLLVFLGMYFLMANVRKRKTLPLNKDFFHATLIYLIAAAIALLLDIGLKNISGGEANLFFIGPSYPYMCVLNGVYKSLGWGVSSILMIAVTITAAFIMAFMENVLCNEKRRRNN